MFLKINVWKKLRWKPNFVKTTECYNIIVNKCGAEFIELQQRYVNTRRK